MWDGNDASSKEILYVGGDAYSAPAVLVIPELDNPWKLYYICRDYMGSITHVVNANGSLKQELSYDAWGRLRNPATQVTYTPGSEPVLFLGRGYTGHEHLTAFGLINMNARLYDPALGRFLSPDPYVQAPDFSQSFNRYSYCVNNPLIYSDKSGEFFVIDDWIIGGIKGLFNGEGFLKSANRHAWNSIRIWGGLFISDPNKKPLERTWEVVSRFTWQSPQTATGFFGSHGTNILGHVNKVDYAYGTTVLQTNSSPSNFGALTLGNYIIGNRDIEADANNEWFQHEYGHYLQSQEMGLGYLPRVAIPSLMSAGMKDQNHDYQPFEQDANRRAFLYFNKNVEGFYQTMEQYDYNHNNEVSKGWNFYENPLDVYHVGSNSIYNYYDYKNSHDIEMINTLNLHAQWYDSFSWLDGIVSVVGVGIGNGIYYNKNRVK